MSALYHGLLKCNGDVQLWLGGGGDLAGAVLSSGKCLLGEVAGLARAVCGSSTEDGEPAEDGSGLERGRHCVGEVYDRDECVE
jgi:hypothetical protein